MTEQEPLKTEALHILLVEDEPEISEAAAEYLVGQGHRVFVARDAPEALRLCRHKPFHVALIDIMLPGVDGLTLASSLRDHFPDMALVGTTALHELPDATEAGLGPVVFKPFDLDDLERTLCEAHRDWPRFSGRPNGAARAVERPS